MEALKARHALELDILNSGLKAVAPKGFMGKKASPAALASHETTCKVKREELQERHAKETAMFLENPACFDVVTEKAVGKSPAGVEGEDEEEDEEEAGGELDGDTDTVGGGGGLKLSRKDRRQAKKAAVEAAAAAESARSGGDHPNPGGTPKEREFKALTAQLQPLSLKIHPIPADGNCLYRAVADQLHTLAAAAAQAAAPPPVTPDHRALRTRAAEFIRVYWEDFAPFLPYEEGDAYPAAEAAGEVRSAVARYCDRMASSSSWGGHPEIRALANVLGCPIVVYREGSLPLEFNPKGEERALGMGGGSSSGVGGSGGSSSRRQLCITFHAHALAAGEHYNSARVVVAPV